MVSNENLKFLMIALRYKLGKTQKETGRELNFKSHTPIVRIEKGYGTQNETKEKISKVIEENKLNEFELINLGKKINRNYKWYKKNNIPLIFKNLRKMSNLSQASLCKELGISQTIVAKYESNKAIPNKYLLFKLKLILDKNKIQKKSLLKKSIFENKRFRIDQNTIPKNSQELTKHKVRIIAHCIFDGSVNLTKSNKVYEINYCNKNEVLLNQFKKDILKVYEFKNKKIKYNNKRVPSVSYKSKDAYLDLLKYTPSYSTRQKNCVIPSVIINGTNEQKIVFLRAFFDDEGWCYIYKGGKVSEYKIQRNSYVAGASKNPKVRKQLIKLLKDLDIVAYDQPYDGKILIKYKRNILGFKKIINFTEGVRSQGDSTYWNGVEKREVLNKLIKLGGWD